MARLKDYYVNEVTSAMMDKFKYRKHHGGAQAGENVVNMGGRCQG